MRGSAFFGRAGIFPLFVASTFLNPLGSQPSHAETFDSKIEFTTSTINVPGVSIANSTATAFPATGEVVAETDADQQIHVPATIPQSPNCNATLPCPPLAKAEAVAQAFLIKKMLVGGPVNVLASFTGIAASSSMSGLMVDHGIATQLGFANIYLEVNHFPCAVGMSCVGSFIGANHLTLTQSGSISPSSATVKVEGVPSAGHIELKVGLWAGSTAQGGPSSATGKARAVVNSITLCSPASCPNPQFLSSGIIQNYRLETTDPLSLSNLSRASFEGTTASTTGALAANVRIDSDYPAGGFFSPASYGVGGKFGSVYAFMIRDIDINAGPRTASTTINITTAQTTLDPPSEVNMNGVSDREAQTYAKLTVMPFPCPQGKSCGAALFENAVYVSNPGSVTLSIPFQLSARGYVRVMVTLYSQAQASGGSAQALLQGNVTNISVT